MPTPPWPGLQTFSHIKIVLAYTLTGLKTFSSGLAKSEDQNKNLYPDEGYWDTA